MTEAASPHARVTETQRGSAGKLLLKIAALAAAQQSALFSEAEKAALAFCEATVMGTDPAPDDFARLQQHYKPRQIVELAMLVSEYFATARVIRVLGVPIENPSDAK